MTDRIPASVWQKFLADDEEAIRRSAPVEPAARDRAGSRGDGPEEAPTAVGDLWQSDTPTPTPWRELDRRMRLRRAGRLIGAAAALALLLALFSCLPEAPPGLPGDTDATAPAQQATAEEAPGAERLPGPPGPTGVGGT
ncbi:hypothetical protein ACGF3J_24100 [Streptomyces sp. NPDC048171]|uniref:hypothetical protein n=1 Tax=Streptomyces sp. NPDC048171 TaxID=3365504 RepID=UPI00371D8AFE